MTCRSIFALSFVLAAALAQNNAAQSGSPILKAGVREVLVPVVVTDKSGHYVTDLTRDDFSVFEDGVQQEIVAFSRSSVATSVGQPSGLPDGHAPAISPGAVRNDSPTQTYLICLDNLHSSFEDFAQVRKALKKFFAEEEPGDSQYALIVLGWKVHVVVDSTRDPEAILAAIGSKALLKTIQDSDARNLATETDRFAELVGHWCGSCECTHPTRDLTGPSGGIRCPALKGQVAADLFSFSERASILNENFLQQLAQLVSVMSTMPTRRTVVFLSDGFNRFPGQELYSILKAYGVNDLNLRFNAHDLQPQLDAILRLAVRYDVRFYSIDSRGTLHRGGGARNWSGCRPFGAGTVICRARRDERGVVQWRCDVAVGKENRWAVLRKQQQPAERHPKGVCRRA